MIEINNGNLQLRLDPEIGGAIVDFSAKLGDRWIPIMRRGEELSQSRPMLRALC